MHLVSGGGGAVARPLPQSIPVEYLMDAVTASEHPDPDPKLKCKKYVPEFGPLLNWCWLDPFEIFWCIRCTWPGKVLSGG